MPEALPYISVEACRLIQRSLDEIYLDADRRTAGDAVGLRKLSKYWSRFYGV